MGLPSYEASLRSSAAEKPFGGASYEELKPIGNGELSDLSSEAIERYLVQRGQRQRFRIPSPELWRFFKKAGFLVGHADSAGRRRLTPTLAGLVVFGERPDILLPQCKIKACEFRGAPGDGTVLEKTHYHTDITGPLPLVMEATAAFFRERVSTVPHIEGLMRTEGPEYPEKIVREAVVNALVHRDYVGGAHIHLQMFRDRIVIRSPGYPIPPLTLERIRSYDVVSLKRNPRIADAAYQLGLMDEAGSGIPSMPLRLREYGLREPHFDCDAGFFG